MNNFLKMCPSGNHMVDCAESRNFPKVRIEEKEDLRRYINRSGFAFGDARSAVEVFDSQGYIDVEVE